MERPETTFSTAGKEITGFNSNSNILKNTAIPAEEGKGLAESFLPEGSLNNFKSIGAGNRYVIWQGLPENNLQADKLQDSYSMGDIAAVPGIFWNMRSRNTEF